MDLLLQIETAFATVEIRGRRESKAVLLSQAYWPVPRVSIAPSNDQTTLTKAFPLLFEEEDYHLLAQSKAPGEEVVVSHRDERTLENVRQVPGAEPGTLIGTIRFRQSVGLSTFTFSVAGRKVDLTVEVFPAKLDYLRDYDAMVEGVQELDRVLPLRYFDETYRKVAPKDGTRGSTLEWLTILHSQVTDLQRSLRYADRHPLLSLENHHQSVRPFRVRRMTNQIRHAVARGQGSGSWEQASPGITVRSHIPVETTRDSLDSVEHRWLLASLESVTNSLTRLTHTLHAEEEKRQARYPQASRAGSGSRTAADQRIGEIQKMGAEIDSLKQLSIMREASRSPLPSGFSSLRLLRSPGYSEAYRLLMALRLGLEHIDGGVDASIARLGSLYEAWCFVEVIRQVEVLTGARLLNGLDDFIGRDTLGTRLVKGKSTEARFNLPDERRLAVRYNRAYHGLTGSQVPDIELAFSKIGWPDLVVLFDAKYRLDASDEHVSFYGMAAPPQEAIGALHRYRDAIVVDGGDLHSGEIRPVVKGAALYPLSLSESGTFSESKLATALERYGIGAIPLLPGNTEHLHEWLASLLQLPHGDLAWSGPPAAQDVTAEGAVRRSMLLRPVAARRSRHTEDLKGWDASWSHTSQEAQSR